jgi:uncharacterized membrane protein YsdA (DUF1294 family)
MEITPKNLIIYLIAVNLLLFLTMYKDKKRAENNQWRIKEGTLLLLALIGGSLGGILGMYAFRHKTKKAYFTIGFPVLLVLQIIGVIYVLIK